MIDRIRIRWHSFIEVAKCSSWSTALKSEILSLTIRNRCAQHRYVQQVKNGFLRKQYIGLIDQYVKKDDIDGAKDNMKVWIMWWQGYDNMPPIVKACFHSVKRHVENVHPLVLLTKDNYTEFVNIPSFILDKVEKGIISLTHFSDIIRMTLLSVHGGLWLDSTIYLTADIPHDIFNRSFFSISSPIEPYFVSECKWASFCIGGTSKLFEFMRELFFMHWKRYNSFIDYYSIDYGIRALYDSDKKMRALIDENAVYQASLYTLQNNLNAPFEQCLMDELEQTTIFNKLSWKCKLLAEIEGKDTFYGYIIKRDKIYCEKNA